MPAVNRRWTPEKIESMRKEVLEQGTTMAQIAEREGVTYQRIQQLIGPLHGQSHRNRERIKLEKVTELVQLEKSDPQIAHELGVSLSNVHRLRLLAGIHRRKWTRIKVIDKAIEWRRRYGYTPAASDWNPAYLIKHGDPVRAERFYESGAPYINTVRQLFGNWSVMIEEAGLPPATKGRRFQNGVPVRD